MITLLDWNSDRKKMKDETERFMFDGFGRILAILINDVEDSYKLEDDQMGHCWDKINDIISLLNALQIAIDAVAHFDVEERIVKEPETAKAQNSEAQQ